MFEPDKDKIGCFMMGGYYTARRQPIFYYRLGEHVIFIDGDRGIHRMMITVPESISDADVEARIRKAYLNYKESTLYLIDDAETKEKAHAVNRALGDADAAHYREWKAEQVA